VKFLGARSDAERLYQAFDIFVLPSLFEGFPLVVVEAECAGVGTVVPDYLPQSIACNDNIRFLPVGDAGAWADAALELAKVPRRDGAPDVRSAHLDISDMCGKISDIYASMIG
jgi:glycosyltransferase EpsF